MSAETAAGRAWSKMWGRFWNRVAITLRSKAISTSGLESAILNSGSRPMSDNVVGDTARSGVVENMKVAVGISMISH